MWMTDYWFLEATRSHKSWRPPLRKTLVHLTRLAQAGEICSGPSLGTCATLERSWSLCRCSQARSVSCFLLNSIQKYSRCQPPDPYLWQSIAQACRQMRMRPVVEFVRTLFHQWRLQIWCTYFHPVCSRKLWWMRSSLMARGSLLGWCLHRCLHLRRHPSEVSKLCRLVCHLSKIVLWRMNSAWCWTSDHEAASQPLAPTLCRKWSSVALTNSDHLQKQAF